MLSFNVEERVSEMHYPKSDYKEYPKTLLRDDFWGQVRRSVNGKPVSEDQIAMIVNAVRQGLDLQAEDVVLDLACGNGALANEFVNGCSSLHGVDFSEYLIEIANETFAQPGKVSFEVDDAAHYIATAPDAVRFTKLLCYGSFPFFSEADSKMVIEGISKRFLNARRVVIGNLPDLARAHNFYPAGKDYEDELRDPTAQIGIWRSASELHDMATGSGWALQLVTMPTEFYAAHYRFDAILTR